MSDKQTPEAFDSWFKSLLFNLNFDARSMGLARRSWNARDKLAKEEVEATRAEYDDKIKAMQAEIDKRDALLGKTLKLLGAIDDSRYEEIPWPIFNKVDELQDKIKELNQRGEDE